MPSSAEYPAGLAAERTALRRKWRELRRIALAEPDRREECERALDDLAARVAELKRDANESAPFHEPAVSPA